MNIKFIKKRMVAMVLTVALMAPTVQVLAADPVSNYKEEKKTVNLEPETNEELHINNKEEKTEEVEETLDASEGAIVKAAEEGIQVAIATELARKEALMMKRQDVVNYAKKFIGNPYVYGGSSLTNGTDCSGFVKGVYSYFGISLPRTSSSMRTVGYEVSFSELMPGDIICYPGHVGIYAGNGQIVNAIDESHGIGMSSATYTKIITIRRIF